MIREIEYIDACSHRGGSVVASFAARRDGLLSKATIHAAVRSDEQVKSLSGVDAKVCQVDLYDGQSMKDYVVSNQSTQARNLCSLEHWS